MCRLGENVEKYREDRNATEDSVTCCMRFACWLTKATDTFRIYNTHFFSTATMVTRTHFDITFIRTLP